MTFDPDDWGPEAVHWPEMVETLVTFGLSRDTASRLVGMTHVTKEMVDRWVAYCKLRGRRSYHGSNAFLISRLLRNDFAPPSWGAIKRLEKKLQGAKGQGASDRRGNNGSL